MTGDAVGKTAKKESGGKGSPAFDCLFLHSDCLNPTSLT